MKLSGWVAAASSPCTVVGPAAARLAGITCLREEGGQGSLRFIPMQRVLGSRHPLLPDALRTPHLEPLTRHSGSALSPSWVAI